MRLISFCKILLLSGCFTTVCTSMNAQDKVMKKQDSPTEIGCCLVPGMNINVFDMFFLNNYKTKP